MKGVITTYVEDEKPTINVKLTNDDKYVLVGDKYNPDTDESQARIDVGDNKATIYLTPRAIQAAGMDNGRTPPLYTPIPTPQIPPPMLPLISLRGVHI